MASLSGGWWREHVLVFATVLLLGSPVLGRVRLHNVLAGHAMRLFCEGAEPGQNVTWRREGERSLDLLSDVKTVDGALWFLPAQVEHSGVYVCKVVYSLRMRLTVTGGSCPEADHEVDEDETKFLKLSCALLPISRVVSLTSVTWQKECKTFGRTNSTSMTLEIRNLQRTDAGNYTCVLHYTFEGKNYISARTAKLTVNEINQASSPQIIIPRNETRVVELGTQLKLRCEATENDKHDTLTMKWLFNGSVITSNSDFNTSEEKGAPVNTLTINKVQPKFLNVPFICIAQDSIGADNSRVVLVQADHSRFYWLVVLLSLGGLTMFGTLLCWVWRVDLALFYRDHCARRRQHSDSKLYDAYVGYCCEGQGASMTMTFALQTLPEVLENKYGYKLFIRGRDDNPGEEVFDVIEDALKNSRRFIIVLDEGQTETNKQLVSDAQKCPKNNNTCTLTNMEMVTHTQTNRNAHPDTLPDTHLMPSECVGFDLSIGVYESLICSGPKLIIIQTGKTSSSSLPPSLGLQKHSKRMLRWHKDSHAYSKRRFWKELRYRMPVPQRPNNHTSFTREHL